MSVCQVGGFISLFDVAGFVVQIYFFFFLCAAMLYVATTIVHYLKVAIFFGASTRERKTKNSEIKSRHVVSILLLA